MSASPINEGPLPGRTFAQVWLGLHLSLLLALGWLPDRMALAEDIPTSTPVGTHTVGLTAGPFFPARVLPSQSSKLFGEALMPS